MRSPPTAALEFDADGEATENVSDLDRHTAALMLHARVLSKTRLAGPGERAMYNAPEVRPSQATAAEPAPVVRTAPASRAPATAPRGRPIIKLKLLPEGIARRQALAAARG